MMSSFNTMTRREIEAYIVDKREKMRKAEMLGIENEYRVYERQVLIAESYLIDLSQSETGKIYKIVSNEDFYFKVEYIKGGVAWGFYLGGNEKETGIPVSMLQLSRKGCFDARHHSAQGAGPDLCQRTGEIQRPDAQPC